LNERAALVIMRPSMPSFDIVSKAQMHEVDNAFNQAQKEIAQRFDFKDTGSEIEKTPEAITIHAGSENRAIAALGVVQDKLVKRKVSLRFFDTGKPEPTSKGGSRIVVKIKDGIEVDKARAIVSHLKEAKLKVQASIQESQVRVNGKNKDDLQAAIAAVRGHDFGLELQFVNFRD
jgi:cyclic-di-GMP-binding protein